MQLARAEHPAHPPERGPPISVDYPRQFKDDHPDIMLTVFGMRNEITSPNMPSDDPLTRR